MQKGTYKSSTRQQKYTFILDNNGINQKLNEERLNFKKCILHLWCNNRACTFNLKVQVSPEHMEFTQKTRKNGKTEKIAKLKADLDIPSFLSESRDSIIKLNSAEAIMKHKCGTDEFRLLIQEKIKDLVRDIDIFKPRKTLKHEILFDLGEHFGLKRIQAAKVPRNFIDRLLTRLRRETIRSKFLSDDHPDNHCLEKLNKI